SPRLPGFASSSTGSVPSGFPPAGQNSSGPSAEPFRINSPFQHRIGDPEVLGPPIAGAFGARGPLQPTTTASASIDPRHHAGGILHIKAIVLAKALEHELLLAADAAEKQGPETHKPGRSGDPVRQ